MGHALALVFAKQGNTVFLTDISNEVLVKARELIRSHLETLAEFNELVVPPDVIMGRIHTSTEFADSVPDSELVLEAIIEDVEAKKTLFDRLCTYVGDDAVVASNTSYLDVFSLAPAALQERLVVTHYFNPPYLVPLVEIVGGPETDPTIVPQVRDWLESMGLVPVVLRRFIPGFIVNRLQRAIGREVLYMIDEGVASPEEIDRAVRASLGVRLPVLGVVRRIDFAGLDMAVRALEAPPIGLATEGRLSPTLMELVEQGHLGVKTGRGFFDYGDKPLAEVLEERDAKLVQIGRLLRQLGEIQ
jgi:3-hydroxybutyryl-CoA dehydrogenase